MIECISREVAYRGWIQRGEQTRIVRLADLRGRQFFIILLTPIHGLCISHLQLWFL